MAIGCLARLCWIARAVTCIALAADRGSADDGSGPVAEPAMPRLPCCLLVCLLLSAAVGAQTHVYKCVDGAYPVYQQTPCQGRAEWRWDVPAEQSLSRGPVPATSTAAPARRRASRPGRARAALIPISADPAACERARQQRGKALARARRLDFVQRRELDDAVHDACR